MSPVKIDVAEEHWDGLFAPASCLTLDTTIDGEGRPNAAPHATAVRVCHSPVHIALTVNDFSHTAANVLATREFVVNVVPFDPVMLAKTRVAGLPFERGVSELERADLTPLPATRVGPPRIAECPVHFECVVEWTHRWVHRCMIVGRVVAASIDQRCFDESRGTPILDRVRPAHYLGAAHDNAFVPSFEAFRVGIPYDGPRDWRADLAATTARSGVAWSGAIELGGHTDTQTL